MLTSQSPNLLGILSMSSYLTLCFKCQLASGTDEFQDEHVSLTA